jgi:hypothetical protein
LHTRKKKGQGAQRKCNHVRVFGHAVVDLVGRRVGVLRVGAHRDEPFRVVDGRPRHLLPHAAALRPRLAKNNNKKQKEAMQEEGGKHGGLG